MPPYQVTGIIVRKLDQEKVSRLNLRFNLLQAALGKIGLAAAPGHGSVFHRDIDDFTQHLSPADHRRFLLGIARRCRITADIDFHAPPGGGCPVISAHCIRVFQQGNLDRYGRTVMEKRLDHRIFREPGPHLFQCGD